MDEKEMPAGYKHEGTRKAAPVEGKRPRSILHTPPDTAHGGWDGFKDWIEIEKRESSGI